jgi:predicted TIM-barrel fold metal-dependent hydrolase
VSRTYRGPIVDVDLHHNWKDSAEILAYVPQDWQEFARGEVPRLARIGVAGLNVPGGLKRRDASRVDGEPTASDLGFVKEQLLDRHNWWRCVLCFDLGAHGNTENPYFGTVIARAVNQWNADTWLTWDDRFYGVVSVALALPEEAAREIRRAGADPRVVAALFAGSPLGRPYGDPVYHPVWEACAEMGLSVDLHPGGGALEREVGGPRLSNLGTLVHIWAQAMHHVTSCIVHGVFEKYPHTRILVKEHGTAWLPYLMWRLDQNYETLKLESRWVKKRPSDYVREHVKLGTQPLEEMADPDDLKKLYRSVEMDDMLCFASDYAHATFDDPDVIVRRLPEGWARKVMCDNACTHYGWTPPPVDAELEPELAVAVAGS